MNNFDILNNYRSRRSIVYSKNGMIACSQPLACQAGLNIFRQGGNAADVAIAVAAALNVTEPCSCGIGGDCFVLFYNGQSKEMFGLNGSGKSPKNLNLTKIRQMGINDKRIPLNNINSVTVPGAVDAMIQTKNLFGSSNLTLEDLFKPAIDLAENGYPVSDLVAHSWAKSEDLIRNASENAHEILLNNRAPRAGEIMTMKTLAQTFRDIAKNGRDGFYKGRVGNAIVKLIQDHHGLMTLEDLEEHSTMIIQPISVSYRNYRLWECPPNGQGLVALMAVEIIKQLEKQNQIKSLETYDPLSAEYLHILIEALRLAFSDGKYFISDPEKIKIPIDELLSSDYLIKRIDEFRSDQIIERVEHGNPKYSSDTVYFAVTDQYGNACSFIFSNYFGFGTGAIPKDCGFTLQNRGSNFDLDENHLNCLEGGKRPYHTIIPSMITKDNDELYACFGVMGGFMQPQGHLQVFFNLVVHQKNVQTTLDLPRFCISSKSIEINDDDDDDQYGRSLILFEDGFPNETIEKLQKFGHRIEIIRGVDRSIFGRGQIIHQLFKNNDYIVWAAGSDPRADGHAIPS